MHTCYSLCTNEVFNLGLPNLNHPTRNLLSLELQMDALAEQISKRAKLGELEKYKYPPLNPLAV